MCLSNALQVLFVILREPHSSYRYMYVKQEPGISLYKHVLNIIVVFAVGKDGPASPALLSSRWSRAS